MKFEIGKTAEGRKPFEMDVAKLVTTKLLVQANSGGGKSWLLRRMAEATCGKVQTIILDPEGEFVTLREVADVLIVGKGGEVDANPRSAGLLARCLLELQVSAVIDIFDLKKQERRSFVRLFIESLMSLPKNLWHPTIIVLDEAQDFCPEKGHGEAESSEAVISLACQGRKRGYCAVLATQRLSKLHKDAAAEMNNKLIGRTSLDVDAKRAIDELGMTSKNDRIALRDLQPGEFFTYGPAFDGVGVVKIQCGDVKSSHPKAGQRHSLKAPQPSKVIEGVLKELADLPKQAEAAITDMAAAKKRIADLEREVRSKPAPAADDATIKRAIDQAVAAERKKNSGILTGLMHKVSQASIFTDKIKQLCDRTDWTVPEIVSTPTPAQVKVVSPQRVASPIPESRRNYAKSDAGDLPKGEAAVLRACIQYPEGVARESITVLTTYKRSTRDAYLQRLGEKGYVEQLGNGDMVATEEGRAAMPNAEPLPTGDDLQRHWLSILPEGERKILEVLLSAYPNAVDRDAISEATDYKRSTRDAYLQRMGLKKIVVCTRDGVQASPNLFD